MRKMLIFGNGLGMSVDPDHFSLANALNHVWNNNFLDQAHKDLISACLPDQEGRCPHGEEELDKLHLAIASCDYLRKIRENKDLHWLSDHGWTFPNICKNFILKAAIRLYDYDGSIPEQFSTNLAKFIRKTKSHVATLNYDKLLYDCFIEHELVSGFSGCLVDGILRSGFDSDAFVRKYKRDFGYYLHLHGSPLFKEDDGIVYKVSRSSVNPDTPYKNSHIVLTHIDHKLAVISSSKILSAYWQQFGFALSESEEIVLFGYSGMDNHLNNHLSMYKDKVSFKVIEWNGSGPKNKRQIFWNDALNSEVSLHHYDCITDFSEW